MHFLSEYLWSYCVLLGGAASNSNIELQQIDQSEALRLNVNGPWFVSTTRNDQDF